MNQYYRFDKNGYYIEPVISEGFYKEVPRMEMVTETEMVMEMQTTTEIQTVMEFQTVTHINEDGEEVETEIEVPVEKEVEIEIEVPVEREFEVEREVIDMFPYLPDDITDIRPPDGLYRAKFDKKKQKWTEAGSPPEPDIEQAKNQAILRTKQWVAAELEIPMKWTDGKYYSVTLEKQNLLSAQLGMYMMNAQTGQPITLQWNATGEPCELWEFEDLLALANDIKAYVTPIVMKQQKGEIQIKEAETYDEIIEILGNFA